MANPKFDQVFWEQLWSKTLHEHADKVARRPPNAHLMLEALDLSPARALDAGCGHGADTLWLAARGWLVTAVDFSAAALQQTVRAAYDIARFTAEDPAAGLPDAQDLATPAEVARDLQLFFPWDIDAQRAAELAKRCEDAAMATDRRITNSEGAGVSAQQSHFWAGNTRGFRGGYATSRHYISVSPIAGKP